ncbi:MAG: polyprenol monophosphomannose synthase [Rikenellaceae bacterium]
MSKKLVIIPTYNEIENIQSIIEAVINLNTKFDILIIDDASKDGTANVVKSMQAEYADRLFLIEREGKLGLGTAYIRGFQWALENNYDYINEMDADFSHSPLDLERMYNELTSKNLDVVVGSRYCTGVNVVNWPMKRVLMSYFASKFVKSVTGMPINDATAGFVGYSSSFMKSIDLNKIKMKGYGFQIEMKYTAWKLGFSLGELSIIFTDRTKGTSKMSSSIFGEAFWGVLSLPFRKFKKIC